MAHLLQLTKKISREKHHLCQEKNVDILGSTTAFWGTSHIKHIQEKSAPKYVYLGTEVGKTNSRQSHHTGTYGRDCNVKLKNKLIKPNLTSW